jgi:phosphonate transport system substrate-binding protein
MPRWYMYKLGGFKPEEVFSSVAYTGSHDKTLDQVGDGSVDVGAMNFSTFKKASKERQDKVNLVYTTPAYVDYVWCARNGIGADLIGKIRDAITGISRDNDEGKAILDSFGAKEKFVAADPKKWDTCREILKAGILPESN